MQLVSFIAHIEEEFEDLPKGLIVGETAFRQLDGWSSMMALILIARIDSEYNVNLSAEELAEAATVNDLFDLVKARVAI
jgi:acyl carrier protein